MGLDINAVQFLIDARQKGAQFGEVVTLGRQDLNVYPVRMRQILQKHNFPSAAFENDPKTLFAEPLFLSLGASKVHSLDFSDFEGASFTHDLNQPIGDDLRQRFDLVYDGGTLEHVFNFPVAIKNCMEMVRPGGWLFLHQCANNWCGHGFYQFSPELFFRIFSADNGFEVNRAVLAETAPDAQWYEIVDPARAGRRVELVNHRPAYLLIQARRLRQVPVLAVPPQQSDYTTLWQHPQRRQTNSGERLRLDRRLLGAAGRRLRAAYRLVEPAVLADRRARPDSEVFLKVDWHL